MFYLSRDNYPDNPNTRYAGNDKRSTHEIIRVLLALVESDFTGHAKEEWMSIVDLAHQFIIRATATTCLDLSIMIPQLAVELLVRALWGIRTRSSDAAGEVRKISERPLGKGDGVSGEDRDDLKEILQETP